MKERPAYPGTLPLGAARLEKPDVIERLSFEDSLFRRAQRSAVLHVPPVEAVREGDVQVFAARQPDKLGQPVIDLAQLSGFPSVRSVIASTVVRAAVPLPQIEELMLLTSTLLPDAETLRNLPGLHSLYAPLAPSNVKLAIDRLPATMRQLAISRAALAGLDGLSTLGALERLRLDHLLPGDSLEPVSKLENLTYLWAGGTRGVKGWSTLARCARMEDAHLIQVQLANLRTLRNWTGLRRLSITGRALKSLEGVAAFERLESISLVMAGVASLEALRGLPRLESVTLGYLETCRDLSPLGALPSLRRLKISQSVMNDRDICHVDSLKPLRSATSLEEVVLMGTAVDDGDLMPLADLPRLRKVQLGSDTGGDASKLRAARPDVEIHSAGPRVASGPPGEKAGVVVLHPPGAGIADWWIFEDLTQVLGVATNYAAETRVRRAVEKADRSLARRLRFDTEGDAAGIYAQAEADLRQVARIINELAAERKR